MSGDLQTYQMAGVLMPSARYVQLVPTGEMHNGVEVVEPRDVTLYVESLKSAWDKQHDIAEAAIERLKQRVTQLEGELTDEQVDAAVDAWFDVFDQPEYISWQERMRKAFKAAQSVKVGA
jgi:hypothetical protein